MANGGSISAALEGAQFPQQGGVGTDLASVGGGLLSGLVEERRRQEALALREAALELDERRVDISEENLGLQEQRLSSEEARAERRFELEESRQQFAREQFETRLEEAQRQETELAQSVRGLLITEFGKPQSVVENMDDQAAVMEFERLSRLQEARIRSEATMFSDGIQGILGVQRNLLEQEAATNQRLEARLDRFETFQTEFLSTPVDDPELEELQTVIQGVTDPEEREELFLEAYRRARPEQAQLLEEAQQDALSFEQERDRRGDQLGFMVDQLSSRLQGGLPSFGGGRPGERVGASTRWEALTPQGQSRTLSSLRSVLQSPGGVESFLANVPDLQQAGVPVQEVLDPMNVTLEELQQQHEAAQAEGAQLVPSDQATAPSLMEGMEASGRSNVQAQEPVSILRETVRTSSFAEVAEVSRRFLSRGLMTREEILDAIPDQSTKFLLDQRLPKRLQVPR